MVKFYSYEKVGRFVLCMNKGLKNPSITGWL